MLEIAQDFEQMAARSDPTALIITGSACVIVGLFVWLGGLGLRRLLVAIVGAVGGGICGFFASGRNIILAAVFAAVGAVIATVFEKIFMAIMTAALAAAIGFAILSRVNLENPDSLRQICPQTPVYHWAIIAVLAVVFIAASFYFQRLISALCCATLGTMLVFAGMILLLVYKGTAPVGSISQKPSLFAAVFVAMTAFGTVEQLGLCKRAEKNLTRKKEANKNKEETDKRPSSWRIT